MTIQVENLAKSFGPVPVLAAVTETFEDGSISVLLGASGCGKTTMLRCIAGLERPTTGRIAINGRTVFSHRPPLFVPVERRNVAMVFQSYAIWPHMTVFENVAYGLRVRRESKEAIIQKVDRALGDQQNLLQFWQDVTGVK